jgi:hypothetical protein
MRLFWPFRHEPVRCETDESAVSEARAELILAELALDAARTSYLRLRESRHANGLERQQSVLDEALHRYHSSRRAVRALEQTDIAHAIGAGRRPTMPNRAPH